MILFKGFAQYLELIKGVPYPIAEFGVHKGKTFIDMVKWANMHFIPIYGIDSFQGMPENTEKDNGHYPKGSFNDSDVYDLLKVLSGLLVCVPPSTFCILL